MKLIYIVEGETGCYGYYRNWLVKAFYSIEKAEEFKSFLLKKFNEVYDDGVNWFKQKENIYEVMSKLDTRFDCDYNGVYYRVVGVEVEEDNV